MGLHIVISLSQPSLKLLVSEGCASKTVLAERLIKHV